MLALMASMPFLFPVHTDPSPGFWSEWWAGALGLAAAGMGLIGFRDRPLTLPPILVLPAVLLLALLLQFAAGRVAFPHIGLLYAIYLLWAALLMMLGRRLAETVGLARLADVFAGGLAAGALIGAAIALLQWLGWSGGGWVFPKLGGSVYANLGQANHHAHYSWLGIASLFYLRGREFLPRWLFWALILAIAFGSVLSGSRSVFVYPVVLLAAALWLKKRLAPGQANSLLVDAVSLVPLTIFLSMLGAWATPHLPAVAAWFGIPASGASGATLAGPRVFEMVSGPSARLEIARAAWAAFLQQPWLGQGAGNYSWASFVAAAGRGGDEVFGVAEHAHNIILQLLAEFGAPVTVIAVILLGLWARRLAAAPWRPEQFWCAAVLGICGVHALLEYPLWYAYFLGPTALLLGATDTRPGLALPGRRGAAYLLLVVLLGAFILASLRADYATMEAVSHRPLQAHPDRERAWRISMDRLLKLQHESLLSPWALLAFTNIAEPSRQQAQDRANICERGVRLAPGRWLVARCAIQLAIAGDHEKAEKLALAVLRAYPAQRGATADELAKAAQEYPEVLPLWRLSQQK